MHELSVTPERGRRSLRCMNTSPADAGSASHATWMSLQGLPALTAKGICHLVRGVDVF